MPKVSVLLSNYNGDKHLDESISSVLSQTYKDFEFIIVDDASTDSSRKVIENYHDKRIKKYYAEKNRNIAYSLNLALSMASGEYIARIDSDDVWELNKLEIQVQYMENHSECGACFTKVNIIDEYSNIANDMYDEYFQLFNSAENKSQREWLRFFFYQGNCLCHPSVVIRRNVLEHVGGYYHLAYVPAEDYELWTRIVMKYPIHILEEKLVRYRWEETVNKISGKTDGRIYAFPNIMMLTRKRIMENIDNEDLVRYFKEDFINPESESQEELECEKAHILLRCSGDNANFLGLEKYEELLDNEKMLKVLEEKMEFSLSEYYKEYRTRNFDLLGELEKAKGDIRHLKADVEEKQKAIENKQREVEQLQFLVDEVMSSTSWKVTSPLRRVTRTLKRRK
ncbi:MULTISPECIES: glycosyltransferase [unclassified Dorea]|uniref:glycosyltransferase n=1 Tax=unclassified Dorea TaxID=2627917 RepID=UPI000E48BE69|nr:MULTISPECIES: glycosyltransferase [unclassified Dorea]RGY78909.1 glycosyltransferase [Dorea sp. AM58-8]RHP10562.1 glycosyltransferase [Dorea sp. AF36-15AT]